MFSAYLQEHNPSLLEKARKQGVDIDTPQRLQVFERSPRAAELDLSRTIWLEESIDKREELLAQFKEEYASELKAAQEAHDTLLDAVENYREIHGVYIVIDYDTEDIVRVGRAPKGSKMPPKRDLKTFGKRLDREGLPRTLYLSISSNAPYVKGEITKDGKILAGGKTYTELKEWVREVREEAYERGERQFIAGSPWKSVRMIENARGDMVTIDNLYKRMMRA